MDLSLTDLQAAKRDEALAFARSHLNEDVARRDSAGEFDRGLWQRCADTGIQAMAAPAEFHAHGDVDFLTAMLVMEALGEGAHDNGLMLALSAHMWTVMHPIAKSGSDLQRSKYLPGMCSGELIGAHAMTEPETGSDAFAMQTLAEPVEGGYRLNGKKCFLSLAPVADLFLAFATVDPEKAKWGVTAFIVDASSDGLTVEPTREKMGLRTVPMADVTFTDVFVPEENRLGPEGAGASLSTSFLEYERCCILASQVGAMARQLDTCVAFARTRQQFGRQIGSFQSISNRIADMKLRLETARLLLRHCASLKQAGKQALLETSLLKLHVSEAFTQSSLDAVRIHGGRGYVSEYGVERDLRDAVGGTIYAGTSDIQRNIVARLLGLKQDT